MNSRHKFLRAEASRDIFKFRVSEITFPGVFKRYFPSRMPYFLRCNTHKTGNNAVEMSQAFHDMARFERFTDLNLFTYVFDVIQNWDTDTLQFYSIVLIFC